MAFARPRSSRSLRFQVRNRFFTIFRKTPPALSGCGKLTGPIVVAMWMLGSTTLFAAFGLTTATDYYQVDTNAGLVFKVRRVDDGSSTRSPGDLMSLVYNGVEYQDQSRGSQINSGFDWVYQTSYSVTVDAEQIGSTYVKVTVTAGDLTHYYVARNGDPNIYMGTYFTTQPITTGELCRYIVRIPSSLLPNGPTPSDIRETDTTVESGDIFGFGATNPNTSLIGQTRSKHYSNMRLKDWSYIGATGTNVGMWMVRDNQEGGSGGPFYRSLLMQTGSDQEITYIINYGEAQTEAFRTSILNTYTLVFTNGGTPGTIDTSWLGDLGLTGFVADADRGIVTCPAITNRDTANDYTVGFANSTAQYWADTSATDGSFTTSGMIPGTYTMKVYKNELAVHTAQVTVSAGGTNALNPITISADPSATVPLWRIGNWDGTPNEFLNADKITTMHPSDVRMADWNLGPYVVGSSSPATGMPCYQWKEINGGSQTIQFNLTPTQAASGATVRVGITCAYSNGRPNIQVNSWTAGLQASRTQPTTRTLTVGTYRGNNETYTFSVPSSALVSGTNNLYLYPISGSGLSGFLSAGYSLDCIDIYQGGAQTLAVAAPPASVTADGGDTQVSLVWSAVGGASSYNVLRSTVSGGPYTAVASDLATTSFIDSGLSNGTAYYYVVTSNNSSGTGLQSDQASATPLPDGPPSTPTGLTAGPNANGVALSWNASAGATSYTVLRSTTDGSGYSEVASDINPTSYDDHSTSAGTTYYYVVVAHNANGDSAWSAQATARPPTIAYYRFEEGATDAAVPAGNPVDAPYVTPSAITDSSGGDDNMNTWWTGSAPIYRTDVPAATIPQTGTGNAKSLQFDGGDDLYNAVEGPLLTGAFSSFTVEAYVKFTNLTGYQTVVGRDDAENQGGIESLFYLSKAGTTNRFRVELITSSGTNIQVNSTSVANANTWYHLAAVGDAATGTLTLYVNGTSVGSTTGYTGLYDPTADSIWTIGRGQFNNAITDFTTGYIDEVRFSAAALAPGQFLNAFNPDTDGDGLADSWENSNFGNLNQTGSDDPDSDGFDNEAEETAGTDPTDNQDFPVVADGDGMDDTWEITYFGDTSQTDTGDFDDDGTNNLTEYRLGLIPNDGSSRFAATLSAGGLLEWPSVEGVTFSVQRSTTLNNDWTTIATVPGAAGTTGYSDATAPAGNAFYRILLEP